MIPLTQSLRRHNRTNGEQIRVCRGRRRGLGDGAECGYVAIWRRQWHPTPVFLPGESHGRRSLVGCSPWGSEESDTTERLHFHFSLSCIGEGNGNPLQCSCLENPRDGEAWWAAVYGVAQSWTRLKRLSSSSIHIYVYMCILKSLCCSPKTNTTL